jgi:hypothetical protein
MAHYLARPERRSSLKNTKGEELLLALMWGADKLMRPTLHI